MQQRYESFELTLEFACAFEAAIIAKAVRDAYGTMKLIPGGTTAMYEAVQGKVDQLEEFVRIAIEADQFEAAEVEARERAGSHLAAGVA